MFIYVFYFILFLFVFIALLIFLRKIQYDRTHQNLLDLRDEIGGVVERKSFLNQPKYRGEYNNIPIQIAFSGDKINGERVSYISYSFVKSFRSQTSIASREWFEAMGQEFKEENDLILIDHFAIRSNSPKVLKDLKKEDQLKTKLIALEPFAYIMFSQAGLMCEIKSAQLVVDIEKDHVIKILDAIVALIPLVR